MKRFKLWLKIVLCLHRWEYDGSLPGGVLKQKCIRCPGSRHVYWEGF